MKISIFSLLLLLFADYSFAQKKQEKYKSIDESNYSQSDRYKMDSTKIGFFESNNDYSIHTVSNYTELFLYIC